MAWQDRIPGMFGDVDALFARHPLDFQSAAELLPELVREQVDYPAFANAVERFLRSKNCSGDHIEHELSLISLMFEPWIGEDD